MTQIISFENITKRFGDNLILNDITFSIEKNELFGIVGRSGSGKSTLLKILAGFYHPASGKVYFNGNNMTKKPAELKKAIGFATQEDAFYHDLSVFENMQYYCRIYGIGGHIDDYIKGLLRSVELEGKENTISKNLSGGMKRRLDIAISLVNDPEIIVMDEPTSNLDPILRKDVWGIIKSIRNLGKTIIVASHNFEEVSTNCSHAGVLFDGGIRMFDLDSMRSDMDVSSISMSIEECLISGDSDY